MEFEPSSTNCIFIPYMRIWACASGRGLANEDLRTGTVSTIPDKPGTMIAPGFVSYTGTGLEVISMISEKRTIVTSCTSCN